MYILTSKTGILTGKLLGNLLNLNVFTKPQETSPIIRWGNSTGAYMYETIFNDRKLIDVASSKLMFSCWMAQTELAFIKLINTIPEHYPIFVRTLLNSYSGRGIVICKTEEEYEKYKDYYYSYFVPFRFELRVHCLNGIVSKIFKKECSTEEQDIPVRNSENNYHFSSRNINLYPKVHALVEEFFKVFPMKMVGLDLGYSEVEGRYYIIEANSCPSLNENTAELYANFIKENNNEFDWAGSH